MNGKSKLKRKTKLAVSLVLLVSFLFTGSGFGSPLQDPDAPSAPI